MLLWMEAAGLVRNRRVRVSLRPLKQRKWSFLVVVTGWWSTLSPRARAYAAEDPTSPARKLGAFYL